MKVQTVLDYIDSFAPFASAEPWDNSGLQVGSPDAEISSVLLCLDVTRSEVRQAAEKGVGLILSHHPLIFHPLRSVSFDGVPAECVRQGICVVSAHTNLDKAPDGVNDSLCRALNMDFVKAPPSVAGGFLNTGTIPGVRSVRALASHVATRLHAPVRCVSSDRPVSSVAVCSGAGAEFASDAVSLGFDALITGYASYHDFLEAEEAGLTLLAAGHFETEVVFMNDLQDKLRAAFPELRILLSARRAPLQTVLYHGD